MITISMLIRHGWTSMINSDYAAKVAVITKSCGSIHKSASLGP